MAKHNKAADKISPNEARAEEGKAIVRSHPMFGRLDVIHIAYCQKGQLSKETAAYVTQSGDVIINKFIEHTPKEWAYIIAHCMLHLCFGHFDDEYMPGYFSEDKSGKEIWVAECDKLLWNMACDIYITKFLVDIKFGTPIVRDDDLQQYPSDEKAIYEMLYRDNIPADSNIFGTTKRPPDMLWDGSRFSWLSSNYKNYYVTQFAYALANSVKSAVSESAGEKYSDEKSVQQQAAEWFINSYPLLGALAANFKIKEVGFGHGEFIGNDISIAAVDSSKQEIYVNSAAKLDYEEWKFVLAHEYLHAGLEHGSRCGGRDPYLWNVACDYVVNGWLAEMQIGKMPADGLLYDKEYKDFSAEEIYDILIKDIRRNSKLSTFAGNGRPDIADSGFAGGKGYVTLDEFCKNALRNGLEYHLSNGRGFIPAGLAEEIKALSMPPIPWDVQLAEWFDMNFAPIEKHRTYARRSRRQSSTPDIPRPAYVAEDIPENSRTYGVIIDTSGSMSPKMIGLALGAAASYSAAKDVPLVRVVFCDAAAYDIGYVSPGDIAGRVEVKGRGGTVLQPAVNLLEKAEDFPQNAPLLIITDGFIESTLNVHREHAFLIPKGNRLPFRARGKVFYFD